MRTRVSCGWHWWRTGNSVACKVCEEAVAMVFAADARLAAGNVCRVSGKVTGAAGQQLAPHCATPYCYPVWPPS